MNKLSTILCACVINANSYATAPTILSVHEWQGAYKPLSKETQEALWNHDISTSTQATIGSAYVDQLIYGWAIFRIHVHPAWVPFSCEITKSVCLNNGNACNNLTVRMLFQNDAVYNDDKSFNSSNVFKAPGKYVTSSRVYMDRCGGDHFDSKSFGNITVTVKDKKK